MLFVHRDAEDQDPELRYREIKEAIEKVEAVIAKPRYVCVVPVRMQETWLLIDQSAIRRAAGNPNGTVDLALPAIGQLESIADPKECLYSLLKAASELRGRRLKKFKPFKVVRLIAENILHFSRLRQLPAFRRFEDDILQLTNTIFPREK